jgi:hypothetical protein
MPVDMIYIEHNKITWEVRNLEEAEIQMSKLPMQETEIRFRVKIPGIAFEALTQDIRGSGGKIL